MEKEKFYKIAKDLIECANVIYLGLYNKKYESAEVLAVTNIRSKNLYPGNLELFTDGDLSNFVITTMSAEKIKQIKQNENISLYFHCEKLQRNLALFGKIIMLEEEKIKNKLWAEQWKVYFKAGKEDPKFGLIKFIPHIAKYYDVDGEKIIIKLEENKTEENKLEEKDT